MRKSVAGAICEAVDDRERLATELAPPVDAIGVVTAGATVTTDIPGDAEEDPEGEIAEASKGWTEPYERKERYTDVADPAHGGMSLPGKMPCITYSMLAGGPIDPGTVDRLEKKGIDPRLLAVRGTCPHGASLAQVPGTVCYGCYAGGGNYLRPNVIAAMARRADMTRKALKDPGRTERWIESIVGSIERAGGDVFRWHDSGDIMGPSHLDAVVEVARRVPRVRFWLPTKEHGTVRDWISARGARALPGNLNVRLSARMLFERMRVAPPLTSSSVASGEGFKCPATYYEDWKERYAFGTRKVKGKVVPTPTCGPCRACWDRGTANVDYAYHGAEYRYRQGLLVHGLLEPKGAPREFIPPDRPRGWEPTSPEQARKVKLPDVPGPVTKIIR